MNMFLEYFFGFVQVAGIFLVALLLVALLIHPDSHKRIP